jgi:hypothetical protein
MYMSLEANLKSDDFKRGIHFKYGGSAQVSGGLPSRFQGAKADVKRAAARLKAATELLDYRKVFPPFLEATSGQIFLPQTTVAALLANVELQDALNRDLTLAEVEAAVATVKRAVSNMTAAQLAYIAELHARSTLLDFLSSFDSPKLGAAAFERRADIVTTQIQGREQESDIVTALVSAFQWLRPFAVQRRPRFDSTAQLAAVLAACTPDDIASRTAVVRGLGEHVATFKMLFAANAGEGAQQLLVAIAAEKAKATFVSLLSSGERPAALILDYLPSNSSPVRRKMPPESLIEAVRSAALASPTEEQRNGVKKFLAAYDISVSLPPRCLRLRSCASSPAFIYVVTLPLSLGRLRSTRSG